LAELHTARAQLLASLGDVDAARVVVYRQCHPGVIVQIHEQRHEVISELGPGQFVLREGAVVYLPR